MAFRPLREKPTRQRFAEIQLVAPKPPPMELDDLLFDVLKKHREYEDLTKVYKEQLQTLKSLEQREKEMREELKQKRITTKELLSSVDMFLKDKDIDQAVERERKGMIEKEAEIERLKKEHVEMKERKQEALHQVQRLSVCRDFMERVVKMTKFQDVNALADHLENLLHVRDKLSQKEREAEEKADQLSKELLTLEDQHRLMLLHKNNELSKLQTELEKRRSEADIWERKWNHIQETAAKKTLLLGQIKMVTLNLYESTGGAVGGEDGVDINDTEMQLEKIKIFIQDHDAIVKQYQSASQRQSNEQKRDKSKKRIAPRNKKS
ncbi:coiled-coil domain-containing protein 42 like-2-like [Thunnus albacares]|uniref:coiled-coil domain-containing protein 42 like-2-like n=1 Tax=Thunnus albacares TaxID=8236 RepID=UPI001CF636F1|nr:coiled-coil domain-containing protein 42 like-2-like [Thunnus albacares]